MVKKPRTLMQIFHDEKANGLDDLMAMFSASFQYGQELYAYNHENVKEETDSREDFDRKNTQDNPR